LDGSDGPAGPIQRSNPKPKLEFRQFPLSNGGFELLSRLSPVGIRAAQVALISGVLRFVVFLGGICQNAIGVTILRKYTHFRARGAGQTI